MTDREGAGAAPATPDAGPRRRVLDAAAVARLVTARRPARFGPVAIAWSAAAAVLAGLAAGQLLLGLDGLTLPLCGAAVAWVTAHSLKRANQEIDRSLGALDLQDVGPANIGALVSALKWPERRVRDAARTRLTALLPAASADDAAQLTDEQRSFLFDRLRESQAQADPDFVVAVLAALPTIGEENALAGVVRLSTMWACTSNLDPVKRAAQMCLPALEQRLLALRTAAAPNASATPVVDEAQAAPAAEPRAPVPPHVEEVLQRVEAEMGNPPQLRVPFLVAAWAVVVPGCAAYSVLLWRSGLWYWSMPVALFGLWATQLHRLTLTARHRQIAQELAALDDVNAVGRLAEALAWPDPSLQSGAMVALTRLLPRMRASDACVLGAYQRTCLYRTLTPGMAWSHPDFVLALLKALEQVGDMGALPPVQALAAGRFRTARQRRVADAARDCLPYLTVVAGRNQQSQILLRASCAPGTAGERLLRPAEGVGSHDPEWLLRAADGPDVAEVSAEG